MNTNAKKQPSKQKVNEQQKELLDTMQPEIINNAHTEKQKADLANLVNAIENAGLSEFMEYIRSPWRMLWPNFVAGVARGVGTLVGAAVVIAIIGWMLTKIISLPLIGKSLEPYVHQVQDEITKYTESTNYNKNFQNMEKLMTEIRDEIRMQNSRLSR